MQDAAYGSQNTAISAHRATQAPCAVTLPYVNPLSCELIGQTVVYKGKAKRLFTTALPPIDSLTLVYERVSETLREAIEMGAISSEETQALIASFDESTDPRHIIHLLQCKIDNLEMAEELQAIHDNASAIYAAIHALGYRTDTLCVGDIAMGEEGVYFALSDALRVTIIDDRHLPYPVQLGLAALAQYFGKLCGTATEDSFIHYSEDYETLTCLSEKAKRDLLSLETDLDASAYLAEFESIAEDTVWSEFMDLMENYYGYYIENDEHHDDIATLIQAHRGRLAFTMADQFKPENTYRLSQGKKLMRRLKRLSRHYEKHACAPLLEQLIALLHIATLHYRPAQYEFVFLTDAYALEYQQAVCMKSIESSTINDDFSESEKHIMETGEYAHIAIEIDNDRFMAVWRNHQLGWLLLHCLEHTLKEYQRHV